MITYHFSIDFSLCRFFARLLSIFLLRQTDVQRIVAALALANHSPITLQLLFNQFSSSELYDDLFSCLNDKAGNLSAETTFIQNKTTLTNREVSTRQVVNMAL